jgi:putative ABC transport system ATP-binding protein
MREAGVIVDDAPPVLRVDDISKTYQQGNQPGIEALRGVTLTVPPGRFVAVMGPSGSGKSTLLRCAAGLESPTTGEVRLLDWSLSSLSDAHRTLVRRRHAAFVFQDYTLLPTLDVWRNVAVPYILAREKPPKQLMAETLDSLGLLDRRHAYPATLSGGQQQRVAIARALVAEASVIYADEPTGALDIATAQTVLDALRSAVDAGRSVLMVTHDPVAAARADEVVIMVDGRLSLQLEAPTPDAISTALLELSGASR